MSKKILLSALLISSFSFSNVFAADLTTQPAAAAAAAESTAITFVNNSRTSEAPAQKKLAISDHTCDSFPFTRAAENNAEYIVIKKVELGAVDPWFFQGNTSLKEVSFEGSKLDLSVFDGHTFLAGCEAITNVSFKAAAGITLDDFIRKYASRTLLERILNRQCKLIFSPETEGVTMLHFVTRDKVPVVTQDAIHLLIKTSKILEQIAAEAKPRGLLATLTFGLFGQ